MYYIVFSRNRDIGNGGLTSTMHYQGVSKSDAIGAFTTASTSAFNITAPAGNLYFAGFESTLPFLKDIKQVGKLTDREKINSIITNLSLAICLNTLNTSGHRPKHITAHECSECDAANATVQKNVYNEYLCADCWTIYWTKRISLAEYVVGLANGTYNLESFSDDDKFTIVEAWKTDVDSNNKSNRAQLIAAGWTEEALAEIETKSGLTF
jgi:hypothetical protein